MSAGNSEERAQMMRALGAEVILVDQQEGSKDGHVSGDDLALVEQVASRTAVARGAYRADQFRLSGNPAAHEDTAGIFAGFSSGAVVCAAERLLAGAHSGATIAVVLA